MSCSTCSASPRLHKYAHFTYPPTHPPYTLALQYPELVALHGRVAALPNVKAYLEGSLRLQKVNNNNLG